MDVVIDDKRWKIDVSYDEVDTHWIYVFGELQNPDCLPDWLVPSGSCHCGSAWGDVMALGIRGVSPVALDVRTNRNGIFLAPYYSEAIGVEMRCLEGHRTKFTPPKWDLWNCAVAAYQLGGVS